MSFFDKIPTDQWYDRVKILMKELGFTQKSLAETVGLSEKQMGRILKGQSDTTITVLRLLCHHLRTNYLYILTGETPEQYAARKRALKISDDYGDYQSKKDEYQRVFEKFFLLSESKQELVKKLIEELSKGDNDD